VGLGAKRPAVRCDGFVNCLYCSSPAAWLEDGLEHPLESYHLAEACLLMTGDLDFTATMFPSDRLRCVCAVVIGGGCGVAHRQEPAASLHSWVCVVCIPPLHAG
jgi:hypothetical protein